MQFLLLRTNESKVRFIRFPRTVVRRVLHARRVFTNTLNILAIRRCRKYWNLLLTSRNEMRRSWLCSTFMNKQNRRSRDSFFFFSFFSQNEVEVLEFSWKQGRDLATWLISNNTSFHVDAKYIPRVSRIDWLLFFLAEAPIKTKSTVLYEYLIREIYYSKSTRNCYHYVYTIRKFCGSLIRSKQSERINFSPTFLEKRHIIVS